MFYPTFVDGSITDDAEALAHWLAGGDLRCVGMPYVPASAVATLVRDDQLPGSFRSTLCRTVGKIGPAVAALTRATLDVLLLQQPHAVVSVPVSVCSTLTTDALEVP